MKAICQNCGGIFGIGNGKISMVCQSCGCYDFKFDSDVIVTPLIHDESTSGTLIQRDSFFNGLHPKVGGCLWIVREAMPIKTMPVIQEHITSDLAPNQIEGPVENKELTHSNPVQSVSREETPSESKPKIFKKTKKLRLSLRND